jgi:hypothetical protein
LLEKRKLTDEQKVCGYDTWGHIHEVRKLIGKLQGELALRALNHDQSKFRTPEIEAFTEGTQRIKDTTYGSPEYSEWLEKMEPAITHHYQINSHHPEHHPNGVNDMSLVDIMEMLCDWKASATRYKNGNIDDSLRINQERFGLSDQLVQIMRNTLPLIKS